MDPVPLLRCTIAGRSFAVPVALVERVFRWPLVEPSGFVPSAARADRASPVDRASAGGTETRPAVVEIPGLLGIIATGAEARPVLDASVRYDQGATVETEWSRLLTCTVAGFTVGLVVDTVDEVVTADAASMRPCNPTFLTPSAKQSAPSLTSAPTVHSPMVAPPMTRAPMSHSPMAHPQWPILGLLDAADDTAGGPVFVLDVARLLSESERAAFTTGTWRAPRAA